MASPEPAGPKTSSRLLLVNWFVLLVLGSGFLAYLLDLTGLVSLPIEALIRAGLLVQIIFVALGRRVRADRLPGHLVLALGLFGVSIAVTFLSSAVSGTEIPVLGRGFYFMFNVGIFLLVFPLIPFRLARGFLIPAFFFMCFAFGGLQILLQDLLISDALKVQFGIEYDHFVNGSIRATSFFASAPRFAEFVVVASCFALQRILARSGRTWLWVALYGVCLWLLYNTFSRSGYLLWIGASLTLLVLSRRELFRGPNMRAIMVAWALGVAACMALVLVLSSRWLEGISLGDASSLDARQMHWDALFDRLSNFDVVTLLFGTGEAAMYSRSDLEYYVVDNVFLAIAEFGGIFGLAVFLLLFFSLLRAGVRISATYPSLNLRPLLAFFPALLVEGLFLDNHNTIFFTEFVLLSGFGAARLGIMPTAEAK